MSLNSVNTNIGAMVALQSLNRTGDELAATQKRISTGFRVADARDDGAAFAVAERVRSDISATTAANQQLGGVKGLIATGMAGLNEVSTLLRENGAIRQTLVRLADGNVQGEARTQYEAALKQQVKQVRNFIEDAEYNGQTVFNFTTVPGSIVTVRNGNAETFSFATLRVEGTDFLLGQIEALTALTNAAQARSALGSTGAFTKATKATLNALNDLGNNARYVDTQIRFNQSIMDAQEGGLGALIDADLAKESARLQALQIRQQLGTQALGIANQAPQVLLSLFR